MTYVLIIMTYYNNFGTIHSVDFTSKERCQTAEQHFRNEFSSRPLISGKLQIIGCFPK